MKPIFSNRTFDALKWVAIVMLPALVLFIAKLFPVWNIPYGDQIAETLAAIQFLLGALLGVSTIQYDRKKAQDNEACYAAMAQEANELREELYPEDDGREESENA